MKEDFSPASDYRHEFPIYSNALTNGGLYGYSKSYQYGPDKITVTARGDIGHAVYRSTCFCCIGRLLVLSSNHLCDLRFVTEFINQFVAFALESTGVPQLTAPQISKYAVALPPTKAEQEAIAEALSDADALIDSLEQLLTKKRQIKQGAMQDLLTGRKRLSGFSGDWNVKRLGATATLKARIGWQGLTTAEYADSGDYYLVTGTDFRGGKIDWENCHYVNKSRYQQDKYIQLKEHDVLVTKDGTIGKIALITELPRPATLNSGVFVLRPIEAAFNPEFFYHLLCSSVFNDFLVQLSAGSTINHLYQKDFVNFVYKTPPTIHEQTAIATILSDMDVENRRTRSQTFQGPPTQAGHDAGTTHREDSSHMKISTVLDHIDSGHMALPEFQRGYVWNRDQVRGLFDSLYRRHPVGGLLVWATESMTAAHRGDGKLAAGVVKLLLDGQQRMTSLYGVVRGKPPEVLRRQRKGLHRTAFSSGDGDICFLPAC